MCLLCVMLLPTRHQAAVHVSTHDKQNTVNASQLLKLGSFKLMPMKVGGCG